MRTYQDYLEDVAEHGGQPLSIEEWEQEVENEHVELELKER